MEREETDIVDDTGTGGRLRTERKRKERDVTIAEGDDRTCIFDCY